MKKRLSFVTNSSSSSFICEICGRNESGWDLCLSDAEMYKCVNGHVICMDEALELTREEMINLIKSDNSYRAYWNSDIKDIDYYTNEEIDAMDEDKLRDILTYEYIPEEMCPICQFIEYSEYDLAKYILKKYKIPRDEVFAEVKKYNKRRKKLYDNEYITYVCKKFNLNPVEIVASWKEKYGTYANFSRSLRD